MHSQSTCCVKVLHYGTKSTSDVLTQETKVGLKATPGGEKGSTSDLQFGGKGTNSCSRHSGPRDSVLGRTDLQTTPP